MNKSTGGWSGSLKGGHGYMHPGDADKIPFSASSRFEGEAASNPEKVLGSALAGCFSMALTVALSKAGKEPKSVETTAHTKLEKKGDGFEITGIALSTKVDVDGIDAAEFQKIAEETKKGCPVSKALNAVPITLDAALA